MGAYICTISERDWDAARELGVYGNRFERKEDGKSLGDSQKLSVIRDLISIKEGDFIFFHIRGRMTPTLIGIEQNEAIVSFPANNPALASWRLRQSLVLVVGAATRHIRIVLRAHCGCVL